MLKINHLNDSEVFQIYCDKNISNYRSENQYWSDIKNHINEKIKLYEKETFIQ